jgi:hypothetical protein
MQLLCARSGCRSSRPSIRFKSIHLPDGEDVSIEAIGLDQRMEPLKGQVAGRNRGKQFLLSTLSGIGATAAMRSQTAQNVGQATDEQIQLLCSECQLACSNYCQISTACTWGEPGFPLIT